MKATVNGTEIPGTYLFQHVHESAPGVLHGEFHVEDLLQTSSRVIVAGVPQDVTSWTIGGNAIALLGSACEVDMDGQTYTGKVVAVGGNRVEWEGKRVSAKKEKVA